MLAKFSVITQNPDSGIGKSHAQPENLLMDHKGNLKVSDFGLSALQKVPSIRSSFFFFFFQFEFLELYNINGLLAEILIYFQPGGILSTACGSPCYVAPEVSTIFDFS